MKKYETRDQLIERVNRESRLTGFAALTCLIKSFFVSYELLAPPEEKIANLNRKIDLDATVPADDLFDERTSIIYSYKPTNIWFDS